MTQQRIDKISGRIVQMLFGAGYVSQATADVFNISRVILALVPDESVGPVSKGILDMCRSVGEEAAEVGFERNQ